MILSVAKAGQPKLLFVTSETGTVTSATPSFVNVKGGLATVDAPKAPKSHWYVSVLVTELVNPATRGEQWFVLPLSVYVKLAVD